MCKFIKDDGEECGHEQEPFCHLHEDSEQARRHAQETSGGTVGANVCPDCGSVVRPCVTAVKEATFAPKMVTVGVGFECDCGQVEREATNLPKSECPNGWYA